MGEGVKGATNAYRETMDDMWVFTPPQGISVDDFSAFTPNNIGHRRDFLPHTTLRFDCLHGEVLLTGMDKIMEFLNVMHYDAPFYGCEESIADMMEYGSEPWVYDLREIVKCATAEVLLFRIIRKDGLSPKGHRFIGYEVKEVYCLLTQG